MLYLYLVKTIENFQLVKALDIDYSLDLPISFLIAIKPIELFESF